MRNRVVRYLLSFIVAMLVAVPLVSAAGTVTADSSAAISTDKTDYEPGGTVVFSGSGFQPGEPVALAAVGSTNGTRLTANAVADGSGAISGSLTLPIMYEETYTLTATGASSGQVARATFGDSITSLSVQTPSNPLTFHPGQSQLYTVVAKNGNEVPIPGVPIRWNVRNENGTTTLFSFGSMSPTISTTSETTGETSSTLSVPLGASLGSAWVWADAGGGKTAKQKFNVKLPTTTTVGASPSPSTLGESVTFTATVTGSVITTGTVTFTEGATVLASAVGLGSGSASFSTSLLSEGSHTITATYNGTTTYDTSSGSVVHLVNAVVTPTNVAPTVAANSASVTVNEGQTAVNAGTYNDTNTGDNVAISASVGTVTKTGTNSGTWSWSYATTDGLVQSQTVTITANDGNGGTATTTFSLTVNNVAPTIALSGAASVNEGSPYSLTLGAITDPGTDTVTGYKINWGDSFFDVFVGIPSGVKTHTYADGPSSLTITVDLTDEDGTFAGAGSKAVTVNNVPPTLTITGAGSVSEGSLYTLSLSSSDPGADTITGWSITWGDGSPPQAVAGNPASVTHTYTDGPNDWTISATATDEDGTFSANTKAVHVNNVAPTLTISGAASVNEGSPYTLSLSSSDPGADTITGWSITWGDGSPPQAVAGNPASVTHTYADGPNDWTVSATATDEDGTYASNTKAVHVNNVAPTIALSGAASVNEGSPYSLTLGAITDPGIDTVTGYKINWGDSFFDVFVGIPSGVKTHTYADGPSSPTITVDLTDEDGTFVGAGSKAVTVNNVAPTLGVPTVSPASVGNLYQVGTALTLGGTFTDPSPADTYTVTIIWDDTTTTAVGVGAGASPRSYSAAPKTYTTAGVYTVTVTVADDDGGISNTQTVQIVIYDPSAGFVTGGGWINSPAGAYKADASLFGKATFGFVSKYQKGANTPVGQTEFQFQVAKFNFHSESYQWLVVAGAKAQYKGTGTVNGTTGYGFLLTATDGQMPGGGGVDKFRIKIWSLSTGSVVYDNVGGSDDIDSAAPQEIAGGSIVIHS